MLFVLQLLINFSYFQSKRILFLKFFGESLQDGKYSGGDNLPAKENCPGCANTKNADGFCGKVETRDYDNPTWIWNSSSPPTTRGIT